MTENFTPTWRLLRRLGVPEDRVDDAVQKVFLIVADRLSDIEVGSERAFVIGTALRVAPRARKRRAIEKAPSSDAGALTDPMPLPDELTDRKRAREMLDAVLAAMPEELSTVLVLYEIEGMTAPEIAQVVGIPLGTAASRLRRARVEFQTIRRKMMPEPEGGAL